MWTLPGKNELCEETIKFFTARFKHQPEVVASAPGRVNLIGEHTDYQEGFVFPAALDRRTVVAMSFNTSGTYTVVSNDLHKEKTFTEPQLKPSNESQWYSYVLGAIACFCETAQTPYPKGFNVLVHTTVPIGSGLSSSAALEVATATAMEAATKTCLPCLVKARDVCQRAEHQWAKVPCGLMDQAIAVMGRHGAAMLFDCKSQVGTHAPLDKSLALIVVNSGVTHSLVSGEYAARKASCTASVEALKKVYPDINSLRDINTPCMLQKVKNVLSEVDFKRATHVVNENIRSEKFFKALQGGDVKTAGSIMYEGHASLKDLYNVTVPETDAIVEIAKGVNGVYGARMTGGGFGGSVCVLVDAMRAEKAQEEILTKYMDEFKRLSASDHAENVKRVQPTVFVAKPSHGAYVYFPK